MTTLRITADLTAARCAYMVDWVARSVRSDARGDADGAGYTLGCAYAIAHELVDDGADPRHVRALLTLGLRAGGGR